MKLAGNQIIVPSKEFATPLKENFADKPANNFMTELFSTIRTVGGALLNPLQPTAQNEIQYNANNLPDKTNVFTKYGYTPYILGGAAILAIIMLKRGKK